MRTIFNKDQKPLNNFAMKRAYTIYDISCILLRYQNFDIENSLSNDTFNNNVRFQRQYLKEVIKDLFNTLPESNKIYAKDENENATGMCYVFIQCNQVLRYNWFTGECYMQQNTY